MPQIKIKCTAIVYSTGKPCTNNANYQSKDDQPVCKPHIKFLITDREYYVNKIDKKLDIEEYNKKIMSENIGKIPLRNKDGKIINFALVDPKDYENVMKYHWYEKKDETNTYVLGTINNIITKLHHFILGKPSLLDFSLFPSFLICLLYV